MSLCILIRSGKLRKPQRLRHHSPHRIGDKFLDSWHPVPITAKPYISCGNFPFHTLSIIYPATPLRRIMPFPIRCDYFIKLRRNRMSRLHVCRNRLPCPSWVMIRIRIPGQNFSRHREQVSPLFKQCWIWRIH